MQRTRWLLILIAAMMSLHSEMLAVESVCTESLVWSKDEDGLWPYHVPGILVTRRGTVLVWADARQDGGGDFAPHHMVLKRSVDQGRTWSANQYIGRIEKQEIYLFGNAVQSRESDRIYFFYTQKHPDDIHRRTWIWLRHSDDDGVSWSEPREMVRILVEQDRKRAEAIRQGTAGLEFQGEDPERYAREQFYTGPGRIIQLPGDHPVAPGRIIIPVLAVKDRDSQERSDLPSLLRRGQGNTVLYSDDQGQTWIAGGAVPMNGLPLGEPSIVDLSDGRLLMNSRVEKHDYRVTSLSTDGGLSWSKPTRDTSGIPTYFETHAGLLRLPPDSPSGPSAPILFSFPNAPTRRNLTIMVSLDDHQSWLHRKVIHAGRSYYSNMDAHGGFIYLVFGRGGEHPWLPAETVLLRFNYEWLTSP